MKGVLICGGTGTRLRPLTEVTNKSLLPVYDQPLVYYPLMTLRSAGVTDIIVIAGIEHLDQLAGFLGSGSRFGCHFSFRVQEKAEGIAQALGLAEEFVDGDDVCAILGDNVFFDNLAPAIQKFQHGGHIFVKEVMDPERFGVVTLMGNTVTGIEEKPTRPRSNYAQTGCYVYDSRCFDIIHSLKPSARKELEISDVTAWYLEKGELTATMLKSEWVDAGTFESLYRASELVRNHKRHAVEKAKKQAIRV